MVKMTAPVILILTQVHIKLGILKQYVKISNKGWECFKYICQKFSFLRKIQAGVFDGPIMRQMLKDKELIETVSSVEKNSWIAFS